MGIKMLKRNPATSNRPFPFFVKIIAFFLCFLLAFEQSGFAQVVSGADISASLGRLMHSSFAIFSAPAHLRYISYDKYKQSFRVILDEDSAAGKGRSAEDAVRDPLKLFYLGLALPNKSFWVNLRPDSPEGIISDYLTQTDLGRIFLEADLELKKDLARSTFPSSAEGREYWEKVYRKIEEIYGSLNPQISINTRIWITPGEVVIGEDKNSAYIYKAVLNVTTEAAYLKGRGQEGNDSDRARIINEYSSELIQELILPKITREVNSSPKYAALRQAYYSLILAQWFKRRFYGAGGLYPYLINRMNLNGLTSQKSWSKDAYFKEYQRSFRDKEYDLRVNVFNLSGRAVRTYSNGGVDFTGIFNGTHPAKINIVSTASLSVPSAGQSKLIEVGNPAPSLKEPYFGSGSSVTRLPGGGLEASPEAGARHAAVPSFDLNASARTDGNREIKADEIDWVLSRLQSSSKKYLQDLLRSRRVNIKERIRFVADELGFDILSGRGTSLLTRRPETLQENKKFLEGLGMPVNVTNLRSSKRYFAARELRQISKEAGWNKLSDKEKLAVASYLFDVYGLRSSWVSRDKNWKDFLGWFSLPDTYIDYSFGAIDFIQHHELVKSGKSGDFSQAKKRIGRIKEILEVMGLKISGSLEKKITAEGLEIYVLKQRTGKAVPGGDRPGSFSAAEETPSGTVLSSSRQPDGIPGERLKQLQSNSAPQAPPGISIRLKERFDRAQEDYFRAKRKFEEDKLKLAALDSRINKRVNDIRKLEAAKKSYLEEGRSAYAVSAERILGEMRNSLERALKEQEAQRIVLTAALEELSSAASRRGKISAQAAALSSGKVLEKRSSQKDVPVTRPVNTEALRLARNTAPGAGDDALPVTPVDLLKELETALDADLTAPQIGSLLDILVNCLPGQERYERARQILRHIHPDEFKKFRRIAARDEPYAFDKNLQKKIASIALERPSDLSVGLVRSMSKIHDWEETLNKGKDLTVEDLSFISACCERIVDVLPLRLSQETNDSIGSIYKVIKRANYLIEKTLLRLMSQKTSDKSGFKAYAENLLARGHYFSDYFGALSYLLAMNIPKGYVLKLDNGNGNGNGNGKTLPKVKYSFWHRLTAVPAMERNAVSNLKLLLPLLNTEGNEFTPKEHYLLLRPTRIGPSDSWALRKPVSIIFSLLMGAFSVFSLMINGSFNIGSLLSASIGVLAIPFMHYGFAIVGWISTKRDIKKSHQRIRALEKKWEIFSASAGERGGDKISEGEKTEDKEFVAEDLPGDEILEEDFMETPVEVSPEDAEALYALADSLRIIPVDLSRQAESLFGPGKSAGPFLLVVPESLMLTGDCRKINRPVRLGNKIIVGDEYYLRHRENPASFFQDSGGENEESGDLSKNPGDDGKDVPGIAPEDGISAVSPADAPGGIDFRDIAFTVRPAGAEFEDEFFRIKKMLDAGIIPNGERLKECLDKIPASGRKGYRERVNNLLADIFTLEERYAQGPTPVFTGILKEWITEGEFPVKKMEGFLDAPN